MSRKKWRKFVAAIGSFWVTGSATKADWPGSTTLSYLNSGALSATFLSPDASARRRGKRPAKGGDLRLWRRVLHNQHAAAIKAAFVRRVKCVP